MRGCACKPALQPLHVRAEADVPPPFPTCCSAAPRLIDATDVVRLRNREQCCAKSRRTSPVRLASNSAVRVRHDTVRGIKSLSALAFALQNQPYRSEEHTSELQSLMRISYAVFCLKKKIKKQLKKIYQHIF